MEDYRNQNWYTDYSEISREIIQKIFFEEIKAKRHSRVGENRSQSDTAKILLQFQFLIRRSVHLRIWYASSF